MGVGGRIGELAAALPEAAGAFVGRRERCRHWGRGSGGRGGQAGEHGGEGCDDTTGDGERECLLRRTASGPVLATSPGASSPPANHGAGGGGRDRGVSRLRCPFQNAYSPPLAFSGVFPSRGLASSRRRRLPLLCATNPHTVAVSAHIHDHRASRSQPSPAHIRTSSPGDRLQTDPAGSDPTLRVKPSMDDGGVVVCGRTTSWRSAGLGVTRVRKQHVRDQCDANSSGVPTLMCMRTIWIRAAGWLRDGSVATYVRVASFQRT